MTAFFCYCRRDNGGFDEGVDKGVDAAELTGLALWISIPRERWLLLAAENDDRSGHQGASTITLSSFQLHSIKPPSVSMVN